MSADVLSGAKPAAGVRTLGALSLLALTLISGAATRGLFGTVQEYAKADMALSDLQLSLVQGLAVSIPVAVLAIPLGRLADRSHRVRILIALAAVWSLGGLITAYAGSFPVLFAARMLTGVGAMCVVPVAISIAADLCAPEARGRSLLVLSLGQTAGGAAAFALGGWAFGLLQDAAPFAGLVAWRGVHLAFAIVTALLILPLLLLREPARRDLGEAADAPFGAALRELWGQRRFLGPLFLGQLSVVMADTAAGVWAAPVLSRVHQQQPADFAGWLGGVLLLAGILGSVLGGVGADLGQKSGRRGGVLMVAAIAAAVSVPAALFPIMPTVAGLGFMLCVLQLAGAVAGLSTATTIAVLVPNEIRGVCLGAFMIVGAILGLGVAPTLVTLVSGALGGEAHLAPALAITGVVTSLLALGGFIVALRNAPDRAFA